MTSPNTIIADMQAEIDALRKENDELLAALEPFAKIACLFDEDRRTGNMPRSGVWQSWHIADGDYELTVEDLRNARSAIASVKGNSQC